MSSTRRTGIWKQAIIDELNTAIGKGWCKCQQACCVPNKTGTVPMPGGYNVTIPYSQILTQYLYGNVSYSDMVAAMGSDLVTGSGGVHQRRRDHGPDHPVHPAAPPLDQLHLSGPLD